MLTSNDWDDMRIIIKYSLVVVLSKGGDMTHIEMNCKNYEHLAVIV